MRSSELFFFSFFSSFFNKLSFFICIYIFFVGEGGLPSLCVAPPCVYKLHSMDSAWGIKALLLGWVVSVPHKFCSRDAAGSFLLDYYLKYIFNIQNVAMRPCSVCACGVGTVLFCRL